MQFLQEDLPLIECDNLSPDNVLKCHANFVNKLDMDKILKGVTTNTKEHTQIRLDYPRMTIHVSTFGKNQTLKLFETYVRQFSIYHNFYGNLEDILLELCTQSTFFYGWEVLHKIYAEVDPTIILCQDSGTPIIYIKKRDDILELFFLKDYVCKNISGFVACPSENNIYCKFHTCIVIKFLLGSKLFIGMSAKMYWCKSCNFLLI
jgi:hypothetical protein